MDGLRGFDKSIAPIFYFNTFIFYSPYFLFYSPYVLFYFKIVYASCYLRNMCLPSFTWEINTSLYCYTKCKISLTKLSRLTKYSMIIMNQPFSRSYYYYALIILQWTLKSYNHLRKWPICLFILVFFFGSPNRFGKARIFHEIFIPTYNLG